MRNYFSAHATATPTQVQAGLTKVGYLQLCNPNTTPVYVFVWDSLAADLVHQAPYGQGGLKAGGSVESATEEPESLTPVASIFYVPVGVSVANMGVSTISLSRPMDLGRGFTFAVSNNPTYPNSPTTDCTVQFHYQ